MMSVEQIVRDELKRADDYIEYIEEMRLEAEEIDRMLNEMELHIEMH